MSIQSIGTKPKTEPFYLETEGKTSIMKIYSSFRSLYEKILAESRVIRNSEKNGPKSNEHLFLGEKL